MKLSTPFAIRLHRPVTERDLLKAKEYIGVKSATANGNQILIELDGTNKISIDEIHQYFHKYEKMIR